MKGQFAFVACSIFHFPLVTTAMLPSTTFTSDTDAFTVRLATEEDIPILWTLDQVAQQDEHRRTFITRAVEAGHTYVIETDQQVIGYAVFDHSFFEQGFMALLYIHPAHRRRGAGTRLMQYLECVCRTPKLFTSTNLSNRPMQALLAKLGYILSGVIHHLDENDPELVYVKYLRRDDARPACPQAASLPQDGAITPH